MYDMRNIRADVKHLYDQLCYMKLNGPISIIPGWAAENVPELVHFLNSHSTVVTVKEAVAEFLRQYGRRGGKVTVHNTVDRCREFCKEKGYGGFLLIELRKELKIQIKERYSTKLTKAGKGKDLYFVPFHLEEKAR